MVSPRLMRSRSLRAGAFVHPEDKTPPPTLPPRSFSFQYAMTTGEDIAATFTEEPFRHSDPKYQCCCHQIHCKAGTRYIFIFGVIGILVNILGLIFNYLTLTQFLIQLILVLIAIGVYGCMFYAMKTEKEVFLLPYIGLMVLNVILLLALFVISLWALIEPKSEPARIINNAISDSNQTLVEDGGQHDNKEVIQVFSAASLAFCLLGIAICIWFGFVVYKYFLYLRDMKRARQPQSIVYHGDKKNTKITELKQ